MVEGHLRFDDYIDGWRFNAKRIMDIDQVREAHGKALVIRAPNTLTAEFADQLKEVLGPHVGGGCSVMVSCQTSKATAHLALSSQWAVKLNIALTERLQQLVGVGNVRVHLHPRRTAPQNHSHPQPSRNDLAQQQPRVRAHVERAATPPAAPTTPAATTSPAQLNSIVQDREIQFAPTL